MQRIFLVATAAVLSLTLSAGVALTASQAPASIKKPDATPLGATEEILKTVSRLRALDVKRPVKSGLKTRDQIKESVIRDLDETTTAEEFEATTKTLSKLGLVAKDFRLRDYVVSLLREQVAGFYEPKTQEFYLASWIPLSEQRTVIAHELVHALQDQHFNLRRFERWPKGDSDAELAAHALVEGEATLVMLQYDFEDRGLRIDLTKLGSLTETLTSQSDPEEDAKYPVLANAPAVLRETLQFPYLYGAGFVQSILKNGSWQALNNSYENLPASTEQILHPQRFLSRDNPVKIELGDMLATLGKEWKQTDVDVNGEFGYRLLLSEFITKQAARAAAEGWGGDRYALFEERQSGALLIAQYTTWDTERDAKEFFDAYSERTHARYKTARQPDAAPAAAAAQRHTYQTTEGIVSIELRGKDVAIIEGGPSAAGVARLYEQIWKSKKTAR